MAEMTREKIAEAIAKEYRDTVKQQDDTCTPKGRGPKNIAKLLKGGVSEEDLVVAIENYVKFCEETKREQQYRKSCGNFFGRDATYEAYLPQNYAAPNTAKFGKGTNESGRVFGQRQVVS
jgi:hypothetical protein